METEDIRGVDDRDLVDLCEKTFMVHLLGQPIVELIGLRKEELVVLVKEEVTHELVEVSGQNATVKVVCHTATVHGLANQVSQGAPRNHLVFVVLGFLQVEAQETEGNAEVGLVVVVGHIPADLTVFTAIEDD